MYSLNLYINVFCVIMQLVFNITHFVNSSKLCVVYNLDTKNKTFLFFTLDFEENKKIKLIHPICLAFLPHGLILPLKQADSVWGE